MSRKLRLCEDLTLDQVHDYFTVGKRITDVNTIPMSKLEGYRLNPETGEAARPTFRTVMPSYKRYKCFCQNISSPAQNYRTVCCVNHYSHVCYSPAGVMPFKIAWSSCGGKFPTKSMKNILFAAEILSNDDNNFNTNLKRLTTLNLILTKDHG